MLKNRQLLITAFALFSMFFGAGNLLLPPLLGHQSGTEWSWVIVGFLTTAVVIPIFGIIAHARLQGSMFDFGKKVSPTFSFVYCILIYMISIAIPLPRTASAVHEISVFPNFGTSSLLTSTVYFLLVLVFVFNRTKILNIIGKFLTPLIVLILLVIIVIGLSLPHEAMVASLENPPFVEGLKEGYQTFDAIGAVVIGGVVIISLNLKGNNSFEAKKKLIAKSGWIAGVGLFMIYTGLILVGAYYSGEISLENITDSDMRRATVLREISLSTLGNIGTAFLSVLVALACFTTAVGITTGTADYFKGLFKNSKQAYTTTAIIACLIGIGVGQLDFHSIIVIAIPILKFIYPITIVLIFLNVMPPQNASKLVFRAVVLVTFIFGILDMITHFYPKNDALIMFRETIPFGAHDFGWVVPAVLTFVFGNVFEKMKKP